jgi:hypothetical protein
LSEASTASVTALAEEGGGPGELHLAVDHHVQGVTVIALHEQVLAPGELYFRHLPAENASAFIVEPVEQGCPSQHSFGVVHRSSLLPTLQD